MPLLPYLGGIGDTEDWTDAQIWSFAISTYLIIGAFMGGLVLACRNLMLFVGSDTKTQKCKCLLHPMFSFYAWIIFDFLSNIIWLIWTV